MRRGWTILAGCLCLCSTQLEAQSNSVEKRYPLRAQFVYQATARSVVPNAIAQTDAQALQNGGDWLLTQQFASGAYPSAVGEPPSTDSQGTTARGMLTAYQNVKDSDHYASAIRTGDYLVNSYPRRFADGDPDIFPMDPLFLEELARITGDRKYSDYVQNNFWNKLSAGTYGANNDQDAEEWATNLPGYSAYSSWRSLELAYLSYAVIAAQYTNETSARDAFMRVLLRKLEALTTTDVDGDLHGLAGAIFASAHTGIDLNPQSGRWASANSTQDLVQTLVGYQRSGGDWPYDTSLRASRYVGDVSVTTWACLALKAWNAQTYATNISKGVDFMKSLQQPSGQILTNPGAAVETETGVQVHAGALVAIGTNDGVLLNDNSSTSNNAPVAQNGNANTNEDTQVAIALQATDADNNPLTYSIVASPAKGGLSGTAPNLIYKPNANVNGTDSFTFRASDGQASSNTATVTINIAPVNDAPTANNQTISTSTNTAVAITLTASDVESGVLVYSIVGAPAHGALSGTPPALTYTPATNYNGSDSFTFKANDGQFDSNLATVTLNITAPSTNANLALNKTATAASAENTNPANAAIDGNASTYWRSGNLSSSATSVWLRVDLQAAQTLSRVVVNWNAKYYAKKYQVQVSADGASWTTVYTDNNGNGGVDNCVFATTNARYVQVNMLKHNKSSEQVTELEIYANATTLGRPLASAETENEPPAQLALLQNYPNPFNPGTTLRYRLTAPGLVRLKVLNALGQVVAILVNGQRNAGEHEVYFDAANLPSGIFFAVLQTENEKSVVRLHLLK